MFADFHIGPIQGADGKGAIHGEFHVARAGGFHASGGNLFGKIRGWINPLAQLHVVIRQEYHPQATLHGGIRIYCFGDAIDETNN